MARKGNPLIQMLAPLLPTLEIIFLAAVFICVLLRQYGVGGTETALMLSLLSLAGIFFLSAFVPLSIPDDNSPMGFRELLAYAIAPRVLGIASAVATIGILFYLLKFEGSEQMLLIGATALAAGSLILGFAIATGLKYVNLVLPFLYRAVPLFLISVYIMVQL
jgi:hypothetical protein